MYRTTAVIDNASLVYLSYLNKETPFFHYLQSLFHTIYFPTEVVKEYTIGLPKEPHRNWVIERLNQDQGFYRYCSTYDSFVMVTVENYKGIDKGEAEAYAQFKKVNAHFIISDDNSFIEALKYLDSGTKVYTTLHLISWLEHSKLLPNWNDLLKHVYKIRPFKSTELREAYLEVAARLGLSLPKKTVSAKCSLSKIL